MAVEEVARPPGDGGRLAGELAGVRPGGAAELQNVACSAQQKGRQHRPDRRAITMESRCVEAAVGFGWRSATRAEFGDVLGYAWRSVGHAGFYQSCVKPPSTTSSDPVMKEESSL